MHDNENPDCPINHDAGEPGSAGLSCTCPNVSEQFGRKVAREMAIERETKVYETLLGEPIGVTVSSPVFGGDGKESQSPSVVQRGTSPGKTDFRVFKDALERDAREAQLRSEPKKVKVPVFKSFDLTEFVGTIELNDDLADMLAVSALDGRGFVVKPSFGFENGMSVLRAVAICGAPAVPSSHHDDERKSQLESEIESLKARFDILKEENRQRESEQSDRDYAEGERLL